jgi:hypothetical protein
MRLFGFGLGLVATGALTALSCSDPVAPPAQGAFYMNVTSGNGVCNRGPASFQLGEPRPAPQTLARLIDGQEGAGVSCAVSGDGSFSFNGKVEKQPFSFYIGGSVSGTSGTAAVNAYSPATLNMSSPSSAPCTVSIKAEKGQEVASGRIWGEYSCPEFTDPSSPSQTSCACSGYILFENCQE